MLRSILSLYSLQTVHYLVPLLLIPYVVRILGPETWGLVAFTQSFGTYVIMVIEFGFLSSASRELVIVRDDPQKVSDLLAGVIGGKILLAFFVVLAATLTFFFVPHFQKQPLLFLGGFFWAVCYAFNMTWFFQGMEKFQWVAGLDAFSKGSAALGILFFLREPGHANYYFLCFGGGVFLSNCFALAVIYKKTRFRLPSFRLARTSLKMGWPYFQSRCASGVYSDETSFVFGLFVDPVFVGYYAVAEKIIKALVTLLDPITRVFFPRITHLNTKSLSDAADTTRKSILATTLTALTMSVLTAIFAPLVIQVAFGDHYAESVPLLRILCFIPPLTAIANVLGIQWMLSLKMDHLYRKILMAAPPIFFTGVFVFVPRWLHKGMALSVVLTEICVTLMIVFSLEKKHLNPLRIHDSGA